MAADVNALDCWPMNGTTNDNNHAINVIYRRSFIMAGMNLKFPSKRSFFRFDLRKAKIDYK